jgi:Protein of unknown function (DUF4019)
MASAMTALLVSSMALSAFANESTKAAEDAGARWLALVDAGKYEESWGAASDTFRANMTRFGKGAGFWERALETSRKPLGPLVRRTVTRAGETDPMPGVPAVGTTKYIEIAYHSEFEHERVATETLVVALDADGAWRVFNYIIRSVSE